MELLGIGAFIGALVWWELIIGTMLLVGFIWSLHEESGIFSVIALGILLSMSWGNSGSVISALSTMSFGALLGSIVIFIALGLFWSVWKWRLFVKAEKENYVETCERYEREYDVEQLRIIIDRNKDLDVITFWIILWPLSALAYCLNDFIIDSVKSLARGMTTVYDKVTNSIIDVK